MNTPTHIILSYGILRRGITNKKELWSVLLGGLIPDIVIFGMFFGALFYDVPQQELWGTIYFEPFWQNFIDCFNSLPILLITGFIGVLLSWRWLWLLASSMSVHVLGDFFLHHDDAHRHFYPFSDWKFLSPVSYWDPDHYGWLGMSIEVTLLAIVLFFSWRFITSRAARVLIILYVIIFLSMPLIGRFIFH